MTDTRKSDVSQNQGPQYGYQDTSYKAAGEEAGLRRLTDRFYAIMQANPAYKTLSEWHPNDTEVSSDKLARFLCGWTGGPKRYSEKYGSIHIPKAHAHLNVQEAERDQWLNCMREALESLSYPVDFTEYLMRELFVPAERIRQACSRT